MKCHIQHKIVFLKQCCLLSLKDSSIEESLKSSLCSRKQMICAGINFCSYVYIAFVIVYLYV